MIVVWWLLDCCTVIIIIIYAACYRLLITQLLVALSTCTVTSKSQWIASIRPRIFNAISRLPANSNPGSVFCYKFWNRIWLTQNVLSLVKAMSKRLSVAAIFDDLHLKTNLSRMRPC